MYIVRGTAPELTFMVDPEELDLATVVEAWVSMSQMGTLKLHKTLSGGELFIEENAIHMPMTQEETLIFKSFMPARIGVRVLDEVNSAYSSICDEMIEIVDVVKDGVIS